MKKNVAPPPNTRALIGLDRIDVFGKEIVIYVAPTERSFDIQEIRKINATVSAITKQLTEFKQGEEENGDNT